MAIGKYQEWLEPDGILRLEAWARDGLTDEQIAHNIGITAKTLYVWKKQYSKICKALKRGKDVVDIEVENALLRKTKGYNAIIKKTFKCKRIEYDPDTGKRVLEVEELKDGYDEVHIPADTTAQIFWLKNRIPEKYREKQEQSTGGEEVQIIDDV